MAANGESVADLSRDEFAEQYRRIRRDSERICAPLAIEDYVVQTATAVSPAKWHLAHTSWFYETFLLGPLQPDYEPFHPGYDYLFNSYYNAVGEQWPRPRRGLLSRPTVAEVYEYRAHVDGAMERLLNAPPAGQDGELVQRTLLGLHHEQQHQELLLTDIKHIFALNPLRPAYRELQAPAGDSAGPLEWVTLPGGNHRIGHAGDVDLPKYTIISNGKGSNGPYQHCLPIASPCSRAKQNR